MLSLFLMAHDDSIWMDEHLALVARGMKCNAIYCYELNICVAWMGFKPLTFTGGRFVGRFVCVCVL